MAEEKKSTEDLLKDYAAGRKEAAGNPEMHPVTRKMLQGEAGRIYRKEGEAPAAAAKGSWLLQLWPRLVFGLLMLAFLVVAVVMSQPGRGTHQVASVLEDEVAQEGQMEALDKRMGETSEAAKKKKLAEVDSAFREVRTARAQQVEKELLMAKEKALATPPPPAAPAPQPADPKNVLLKDVREVVRDEAPSGGLAAPRPEPSAVPARGNSPEPAGKQELALGGNIAPEQKANDPLMEKQDSPVVRSRAVLAQEVVLTEKPAELRQNADSIAAVETPRADGKTQSFYFQQVPQKYRRNFQSPPRQVVLSNFTMRIAGEEVTIFDEGGSAYQGQISGSSLKATGVKRGTGEQVKISGTLEGLEQATNVQFRGRATVGNTTIAIQAVPRERE